MLQFKFYRLECYHCKLFWKMMPSKNLAQRIFGTLSKPLLLNVPKLRLVLNWIMNYQCKKKKKNPNI